MRWRRRGHCTSGYDCGGRCCCGIERCSQHDARFRRRVFTFVAHKITAAIDVAVDVRGVVPFFMRLLLMMMMLLMLQMIMMMIVVE